MKLDKKDQILLDELRVNSRIPLTQLARRARLSKENAHYRLKRLSKFTKYITAINYAKVGYKYFLLSIKLSKSSEDYSKIIDLLKKSNDVLWLADTSVHSQTSYNVRALIIKRTKVEAESFRYGLTEFPSVKDTAMQLVGYLSTYCRGFVDETEITEHRDNLNDEITEKFSYDKIDLKIISMISTNSRLSNLEVANRIGVASSTIKSRIDKLIENEVILRFTTALDYTQLDGVFSMVLMRKRGKKLSRLAKPAMLKHAHNVFQIVPWFSIIRAYYFRSESNDEFVKILDKLDDIPGGIIQEASQNINIEKNLIW